MTPLRAKVILFSITFGLGLIAALFSVGDLALLYHGFADPQPVLVSEPGAGTGFVLSLMAFGIAAVCLLPSGAAPSRRGKAPPRSPWTGRFLVAILVAIVAALLAPTVQYRLVDAAARGRGYVPCPAVVWPRRQPDRWALPGATGTPRCPPAQTPPAT